MPRYIYTAKSGPQKTIKGNLDVESEQDAINKLSRMGYFPVSIQPETESINKSWGNRVSKKELATLTRQLASLTESGINILNALNILTEQTPNKYLKSILEDVVKKVEDGKSLSSSLATHPEIFPNLYAAMVHSGETGGSLEQALRRLADFLEKEEEFINSVRAALAYPIFILCVGILTVLVLLTFVVPKLVGMFEDMEQALPLPTKILIDTSVFLRSNWWLILICCMMLVFMLRRFYRSPQGKLSLDSLKLKMVLFGEITLKTEIGRLMRTLSLLLSSGVSVINALDTANSVVTNQVLKNEILNFKEGITNGASFSKVLKESRWFPAIILNIVSVGEETGTLEKALLRIADEYEKEVDRSLKAFTRLLEPIIILVMGLVVGFIVLSMLLPILQINLAVK